MTLYSAVDGFDLIQIFDLIFKLSAYKTKSTVILLHKLRRSCHSVHHRHDTHYYYFFLLILPENFSIR